MIPKIENIGALLKHMGKKDIKKIFALSLVVALIMQSKKDNDNKTLE